MEDRESVDRIQRGDRDAFEALVKLHQDAIYGYLRARLLDKAEAEDLTQEVFLRSYIAMGRFNGSGKVRPWLIGIARNLLREHARKMRRKKEVAWTDLCLEMDSLVEADRSRTEEPEQALMHLPGCLEALGPNARHAIDLHYRSKLRLSEIGERLHRSEGAVKLLVFRARQALRHCIEMKLTRA